MVFLLCFNLTCFLVFFDLFTNKVFHTHRNNSYVSFYYTAGPLQTVIPEIFHKLLPPLKGFPNFPGDFLYLQPFFTRVLGKLV